MYTVGPILLSLFSYSRNVPIMCPADDLIQPCRHNFIYPISESLPLAWIQDRLQLRGHMATVRAVPPEPHIEKEPISYGVVWNSRAACRRWLSQTWKSQWFASSQLRSMVLIYSPVGANVHGSTGEEFEGIGSV